MRLLHETPAAAAPEAIQAKRPLNILIFNHDLPIFPGGGGVEYLNTIGLARRAGRVGLVSIASTPQDEEHAEKLAAHQVQLYLWNSLRMAAAKNPAAANPPATPPSLLRRLRRKVHRSVVAMNHWRRMSESRPADTVQEDLVFATMAWPLLTALSEHAWDALVVVQSSSAAVIDYMPRQLVSVLVMHDIRSLVFSRRAEAASSPAERQHWEREAERYFRFERDYTRKYDLVVALSDFDAAWVREHYGLKRVVKAPLPVDGDYFSPMNLNREGPPRIVFPGMMNHPPNIDAAVFFARDVMPLIQQAVPDAEFLIVGKRPTEEVQALGKLPGVTVTGEVPDTRPYMASAAVVVVPLRYGSGVRHKILEAWGLQRCIVSTTLGAEGLDYKDGLHLAIADGAPAMAATVVRALRDRDFRESLQYAGRAVALSGHHPDRIAADYYRHIEAVAVEKCAAAGPMRLAIDLRWMKPGLAGGIENLARSFLQQLFQIDRHNRYTILLPTAARFDFDVRGRPNIHLLSTDTFLSKVRWFCRKLSWRAHAILRLDLMESYAVLELRQANQLDAQIAYSLPGFIQPDLYPLRQVLVVPDIQHEYFPEFFPGAALEERQRVYGDSIKRADHICAISEFTRQTLIERLGAPPDKITTVHLAADPRFNTAPAGGSDAGRLARYDLEPGGYVYFPAHTWRHKNHRAVIEALRILRDKYSRTVRLVCTGGSREARPELEHLIGAYNLNDQVRFLGYCPADDLPALYRGAACLVYPSLFEGFGMPVLEAMACGCPVVCSNGSSLPEISGDAALLTNPHDHYGLANAMHRLLHDADLRAELRLRGLVQAARFNWRRHTLETIAVFHRVHKQLQPCGRHSA